MDKERLSPRTNTAVEAVLKAAAVFRSYIDDIRQESGFVHRKRDRSLVTKMDQLIEATILDLIRRDFPDDALRGEETGDHGVYAQDTYRWLIDPLDGTFNFVRHIPVFCVSIAYEYHDQIQGGVVYDFNREELFVAERGKGAYLNGERLRVSGLEDVQEAVLAVFFPCGPDTHMLKSHIDLFEHMLLEINDIRRIGAAALDLCWVAAGRLDGCFEVHLRPWDIAAGIVMVEEAGGIVSDWAGAGDYLTSGNIVATNQHLHKWLLKKIDTYFTGKEFL